MSDAPTRSCPETAEAWPPMKMALWNVLMRENLNDGHYIKAFDLIEKLYDAVAQAAPDRTEAAWVLLSRWENIARNSGEKWLATHPLVHETTDLLNSEATASSVSSTEGNSPWHQEPSDDDKIDYAESVLSSPRGDTP